MPRIISGIKLARFAALTASSRPALTPALIAVARARKKLGRGSGGAFGTRFGSGILAAGGGGTSLTGGGGASVTRAPGALPTGAGDGPFPGAEGVPLPGAGGVPFPAPGTMAVVVGAVNSTAKTPLSRIAWIVPPPSLVRNTGFLTPRACALAL